MHASGLTARLRLGPPCLFDHSPTSCVPVRPSPCVTDASPGDFRVELQSDCRTLSIEHRSFETLRARFVYAHTTRVHRMIPSLLATDPTSSDSVQGRPRTKFSRAPALLVSASLVFALYLSPLPHLPPSPSYPYVCACT